MELHTQCLSRQRETKDYMILVGGAGALGEYFPKEVIQSVSERMHRT